MLFLVVALNQAIFQWDLLVSLLVLAIGSRLKTLSAPAAIVFGKNQNLSPLFGVGGKYLDLVVGVLPSNSQNKFLAKSNSSSIKLHIYHEIINAIESLTRQVVKFASEREVEGGVFVKSIIYKSVSS